jgi:hypothetical protein
MIDGELLETAPGQICTQYGLMDHINLWRSTPVREGEEGCLCLFVFHTTFLVFGDVKKSHTTELLRRLNNNYLGDTKYIF